ncbi:MAG: hypothetical protein A3H69_01740 [Candidatus Sungbacteria bacterium RIFCSPLOWO2_02_FULL_47_9]|uniref:Cell shape-determining protein MreC n=1 Tax=Candidatus Sungbacteria bacterium RIFCSPHIGHO2_01_FULL_47_32 TaxID=1802264 RepID=A0A1G2K3A0_9BACT|nr:MAG: hypothetical protein UX72_C0001G0144 [Parcubacteria group bacterium GW2011_GWA2_47_10]OGZ93909.1 MAG: hypothetical protein A2633_05335 [Candidatus Sungbacteria bacterium RIFCSPHIGHO2_01_FULL_47_32]OGZ99161.1 MAG: hypothetical protein A3D57_05385 [Candidatus Sungbacteria bacterium RIFCSPHIGHO2_02_FULL_46_12]OHA06037.1 MAG: hypothetical protein A3A28_05395 [Candidatus Sungbacteria bacterium RIFCSPLOWO2_01_FULL_47_32]OHA09716.1 MAG: hypothetical protein A3H69_01740 [Candidatus Sungbacteria
MKPRTSFFKRNLLVIGLSALAGGSLFFYKTAAPPLLKEYAFWAASPVMVRLAGVSTSVREHTAGFARGTGEEIKRLREENNELAARVNSLASVEKENRDLKDVLKIKDAHPSYSFIPSRLLGFFHEGSDEFIIISGGTTDGIHSDMLVLDAHKVLVGRIVESYGTASKAKLITSPSETLNGTILPSATKVLIKGSGFRELSIELVPGNAEVHTGDIVYSAESAQYVGLIPAVGKVVEVRNSESTVFKSVKAFHLYDPQSSVSGALVVVRRTGE